MNAPAPDPEDGQLIAAWCRGDAAAFDALYARWRGPVWRFLVAQAGAEIADELHQETWLAVVRGRDRYREQDRFAGWLFTLARNCVIDAARRRAARPEPEQPVDADTTPADGKDAALQLDGERRAGDLRAAVAALPDAQRETVLLRWEAGMTLPEIANHVGVPVDTVKSRLRYAMARLREEFPDHGR